MEKTFGNTSIRSIRNVQKCSLNEDVYIAEVEISFDGQPYAWYGYAANSADKAETGKFVYEQIIAGNFEGEITMTVPAEDAVQPTVNGAQTL